MTGSITVLICDDDPRICLALQELVHSRPDLNLAAIAHDAAQAITLAEHHRPTIAIVDARMPSRGPHAVRGILHPTPRSSRTPPTTTARPASSIRAVWVR